MHEIVTIQLGRRANYLCTHYWNTQESYQTFAPAPPSLINHDVHFRAGIASDGTETYLPRTLVYDLKSGFGSLARTNVLGAPDTANATPDIPWNGSLIRMPLAPQSEPSLYTKSLLDSLEPVLPTVSTTPFFADFASTYFHPRSIIPITPPFPTVSSTVQPELASFAISGSAQTSAFEAGADLFVTRDADVDIIDTDLRPWLEECDSMQAVQIFTSSDDSWAGFATKYVERLRDELGKGCIWVWGIDDSLTAGEPGRERQSRSKKLECLINRSLAVHGVAEQASMFVPLTLPDFLPRNIAIDSRSLWHTSALLEAVVESSTIATRLRDTTRVGQTLRDWQDVLSGGGRQTIAQLTFDLDFDCRPVTKDTRMRSSELDNDNSDTISLKQQISLAPSIQGLTRGTRARSGKTFSKIESFRGQEKIPEEALLAYKESMEGDRFETYSVPMPVPMLPTYPKIFLEDTGLPARLTNIHTSLETCSDIAKWVRSLQAILRFGSSNIGGEEREAVYDYLGGFAEKYVEDWESDDGSDDDE